MQRPPEPGVSLTVIRGGRTVGGPPDVLVGGVTTTFSFAALHAPLTGSLFASPL